MVVPVFSFISSVSLLLDLVLLLLISNSSITISITIGITISITISITRILLVSSSKVVVLTLQSLS